jgi:hypothetical protein
MTQETPLVAAFGRDKKAIDIANNFNLKWCKRTMQMVLAAMHVHDFVHKGKLGLMLEPVRRAQRIRCHYGSAAQGPSPRLT